MLFRQLCIRALAQLGRQQPALPCALPASLQLAAWLSTAPPLDADSAAELTKSLRTQQFFERCVEPLRASASSVPLTQLLEVAQQHDLTPAAAEDAIGRLERAGQLITLHGTVLLRPGEVAEALNLLLPSSSAYTEQRLAVVQQELDDLEEQQQAIGRRARWRQAALVWGGLASQSALWLLLFRLTFYELSWDVMEPICFFVGGGQAMACYLWFMATRKEFGWEAALDRYVGRWEAAQLVRAGFDTQRYARLKREAGRLQEMLAVQQAAEAAAAAAQASAEADAEAGSGIVAGEGKKEA